MNYICKYCVAVAVLLPPGFISEQVTAKTEKDSLTELRELVNEDHTLPRYAERYYHPLGRNAVVDALLGDPLYLPTFGNDAASALARARESESIYTLFTTAVSLTGFPRTMQVSTPVEPLPPDLARTVGDDAADVINEAWEHFLTARQLTVSALSDLTDDEKEWLRQHPDAWFMGPEKQNHDGEMAFFTTDTTVHLAIFRLAATVDINKLTDAEAHLALATDIIQKNRGLLQNINKAFSADINGIKVVIAGPGNDRHTEDADFLLDTGGDDYYINNAGGTGGTHPTCLCVDLSGNDIYEAASAVQGAGFLGTGLLADLAGDDRYEAEHHAQGAAYFGGGMLIDLAGDDFYHASHFVQGAAAFGISLLYDESGNDIYVADGFAQAASTTQGGALLLDSGGNDNFTCGGARENFWSTRLGIGQGGASGVRDYPWNNKPTFYGGVAILDDEEGNDSFYTPLFGMGGAYVLGAGIHINGGGNDHFTGGPETMGAVVHLAAGLFIKYNGDDVYNAGWGALGVAGDRGAGVFIDTAGNDKYHADGHCVGTARKPKAVGLFADLSGDDHYTFSGNSCGRFLMPADPENYPRAFFIDLGGNDTYPDKYDELMRGNDTEWIFNNRGTGIDRNTAEENSGNSAAFFSVFPVAPRINRPFFTTADPANEENYKWINRTHNRLVNSNWPKAVLPTPGAENAPSRKPVTFTESEYAQNISTYLADCMSHDYGVRRRAYEQLDLARFTGAWKGNHVEVSALLANPSEAPEERLAFAALWSEVDKTPDISRLVSDDIINDRIKSAYARKLLIRAVGKADGRAGAKMLINRLKNDKDSQCRREAAFALGKLLNVPGSREALEQATADPEAMVRISICKGLRDSDGNDILPIVKKLMRDENLYVRRAAAVTAISLADPEGVDVLLDTLKTATLDTGDNYGHNLYAVLGQYLGPELSDKLGLDSSAWLQWWNENRDNFDLRAAVQAYRERKNGDKD
ncbi:MAG TPA: hypothetical protein ENJ06_00900 [Phycisphaeraceae bacterium]|nr:hypothetical protein [Phycisphaeraceae bacterium]